MKKIENKTVDTLNTSNRNKGITLIALVIIVILLLMLAGITIVQIFTNIEKTGTKRFESAEATDNIQFTYEKKPLGSNKIQLFIIVKEEESGLNEIEYPDGDILNCNGRNYIGIDYTIDNIGEYKFNITSNNGDSKEVIIREEDIDLFGVLANDNKTVDDFGEYGVTISRSGRNEHGGYHQLYSVGMGSTKGTNYNTFILTIDYPTLVSKLGMPFKGIHGEFSQYANNNSSNTSWINSQIIVTYDDGTKTETPLHELSAYNTYRSEQYYETAMFDENKNVSKIEMIINMLDGWDGSAGGGINNIRLIKK